MRDKQLMRSLSVLLVSLILIARPAPGAAQSETDDALFLPLIMHDSDSDLLDDPTSSSLTPVIFIPGYAASSPKTEKLESFIFNRGPSPEDLTLSAIYDMLFRSLENAGYEQGETLFAATFDWRMAAAPVDEEFNAYLEQVTASSITAGTYEYAVNYVGYWLDQAVQASPDLEYVDVVTHSTGGILARAYIQSAAYGGTYVDAAGVSRTLPKIRYLIIGAGPFAGTVHSWRPWSGDFQDVLSGFIPTTEIEGRLAAFAYETVRLGGTVTGPDYDITRASILETDIEGKSRTSPTAFFRLYNPMRQRVMPTSDFLTPPGSDVATNVNDDPTVRSDLLLDLNALSTDGDNPWVERVGTEAGEGGVIVTFASGAKERKNDFDFIVPGLINNSTFICTVVGITQLDDDQGEYLPLPNLLDATPTTVPITQSLFSRVGDVEQELFLSGDGNATYDSYLSTFENDPNVELVMWGNGTPPTAPPDADGASCPAPAALPDGLTWRETEYPVYHDVFFYNPDVRSFVVSTLTGEDAAEEEVITTEELFDLLLFLEGTLW